MSVVDQANNSYSVNDEAESASFYRAVEEALKHRGLRPGVVCPPDDAVARRVLAEYGALFVASERVEVPPVCVFSDAESVEAFQLRVGPQAGMIGGVQLELQPAAMQSLLAACDEAVQAGFQITPRGGTEAARRSYDDTVRLWASRVIPALDYWTAAERVTLAEAERVRSLKLVEQVKTVLDLEAGGCFFSRDFSKSILQSVAPPGASQHLAMLAFDVTEFKDREVRSILARHGWFQTVASDLPHFTFLDRSEHELPTFGLKRVEASTQVFWIPNTGSSDK